MEASRDLSTYTKATALPALPVPAAEPLTKVLAAASTGGGQSGSISIGGGESVSHTFDKHKAYPYINLNSVHGDWHGRGLLKAAESGMGRARPEAARL